MNTFRRSAIIDIDGTLYDNFSRDDKKIISEIFKNNTLVKLLDKCLWFLNSLDFISNSMHMLNLRLKFYSILSYKYYDNIKEEYKIRYQKLLLKDLQTKCNILKEISEIYDIILVTNNIYAINIIIKNLKYNVIFAPNVISRRNQIRENNSSQLIGYVIGNNYTDDIVLAKNMNISSIYVGRSVIKNFFKADDDVLSFNDVLNILKNGS